VADSQKLQVLKALTTLIEGTSVTPYTDITLPATLAGLVFRGRHRFADNDPPTMVSILEAPRPGPTNFTGENEARKEDWLLLVQGWCPDDKRNPTDPIYSLLDDVERRLVRVIQRRGSDGGAKYAEHYMLGNLVTSFRAGPGVVRPPTENVSSRAFFYLPVQVGLARILTE
jgi:hypothetical protein